MGVHQRPSHKTGFFCPPTFTYQLCPEEKPEEDLEPTRCCPFGYKISKGLSQGNSWLKMPQQAASVPLLLFVMASYNAKVLLLT